MDFQFIVDRALEIRKLYEEKERQLYGSQWTSEEIALGFVGDVGDLAKLVIAENGKRRIENHREKLEHEISDCLWSLIVLAHLHQVDMEKSFLKTMDGIQEYLLEERNSKLHQSTGIRNDS